MEIKNDKEIIVSKKEYSLAIEKEDENDEEDESYILDQYEIIIENHSNSKLVMTLYETTENLTITKYSNTFALDYFISQSQYLKCLSIMSKNPYTINDIFKLLNSKLEDEKIKIENNFVYNRKKMNVKIVKLNEKGNTYIENSDDKIYIEFIIYLCNLKKEKIILELNKDKVYGFDNENIPPAINELIEQNQNLIRDISNMEKDLKLLTETKNQYLTLLKKCDAYYGQSMKMKMELMDMGVDSDIFKSMEDFEFILNNISQKVNKPILDIKQIFKASSNGDNIMAFQDSCYRISNIFVLILTNEKKCFGGFTQAWFDNSNRYKGDENAFLFSINNKEIYPILNKYKKMAINCYDDYYISVFGNDIYICDCFFSNNENITQEGFYDYSNSKIKGDYKLTGKKFFNVAELEAYHIFFAGDVIPENEETI